jgi:hypothetical protein
MTVPAERAFMRDLMAPEAATGVITDAELAALTGDADDRRIFYASGRGPGHRRRNRHVLEAAFDLADELARAGGRSTPRVEFARAEVARLRAGADREGRRGCG